MPKIHIKKIGPCLWHVVAGVGIDEIQTYRWSFEEAIKVAWKWQNYETTREAIEAK